MISYIVVGVICFVLGVIAILVNLPAENHDDED